LREEPGDPGVQSVQLGAVCRQVPGSGPPFFFQKMMDFLNFVLNASALLLGSLLKRYNVYSFQEDMVIGSFTFVPMTFITCNSFHFLTSEYIIPCITQFVNS
jgi:hypothetical protein